MRLKNADLRIFIKESGLKSYQVSELLGKSREALFDMLRYELSEEEKRKIKQLITENKERFLNAPTNNIEVRTAILKSGLKYYEVAMLLDVSPVTLSRWLSHELTEEKKKLILHVIEENTIEETA